jgi:hypothetical protein
MFQDANIVGSWPALAARLDGDAVLSRWAESEPELAGLNTVAELLAVWSQHGADDRINTVLAALTRVAGVEGGRDDDALLLTLHLLSGLVWTMAAEFRDLSPDIVAVVVGELACQVRLYPCHSCTLHDHTLAATHMSEAGRRVSSVSGVTSGWVGRRAEAGSARWRRGRGRGRPHHAHRCLCWPTSSA